MAKHHSSLPEIYEQYLTYYEQTRQVQGDQIKDVRRILEAFYGFLKRNKIILSRLRIEQIDAFMTEYCKCLAQSTAKIYRYYLRGFLKYLYHESKTLKKDLAPLVLGPPQFAQAKPPKFLRPHEIQKLFTSLKLSTPSAIRTYAIVYMAYSLGLRPKEISLIKLDDISFKKKELILRRRKGNNPVTLPIPEDTVKAIAAYLINVRPDSQQIRSLFLNLKPAYKTMSPASVAVCITKAMKKAGLSCSSYWLRHTYAQNLLHAGQSIYEIKEMLGHQNIQSTQRYLSINTDLMRKVMFNEIL
jgi:integrase/recombinase XerD